MTRVLIVDDEATMLAIMKRKLSRIEGVEIAGSCRDARAALDTLANEAVDLAFIDVKIADDNGIELARRIRELDSRIELVFVTSHKEYAIDSFDAYPLDYMVKPVSQSRLERTIEQFKHRKRIQSSPATDAAPGGVKLVVQGLGGLKMGTAKGAGAVRWISSKSQEIFAYLLLCKGQAVSRSRLIEDVFPDTSMEKANTYLNTAVYQLRQVLKPFLGADVVVSSREEYALETAGLEIDFVQFEEFAAVWNAGDEGDLSEALVQERRYEGDLFEGKSYVWMLGERARLEAIYERLARKLIRRLLADGRSEEAVPIARKLAQRQELGEAANLLLLEVYCDQQDIEALEKQYADFTGRCLNEIGQLPSGQFVQAYWRLRNSMPASQAGH